MDFYTTAIIQGIGFAAMGLGIYISLRIFNIPDITTDGSYTLGGAITSVCLLSGCNMGTTLFLTLLGGALAGMSSGIIHTRLKVNPLLAGILVMTALYSVNLGIMGRSNLPLIDTKILFDSSGGIQTTIIITSIIAFLVFMLTVLLKTDFGIAMRATGNNDKMVRAFGVNTNAMKVTGLALANMLTALSGFILVQYQGFADINMGIGIVISGLASVMIGEAIVNVFRIRSIFIHLAGVVVGSILFRLILALVLDLGLNPNYLKLITAFIVLLIVGLTQFRIKQNG